MLHRELTDLCIKAFFQVYNELGYGFLEKVYERAMAIELRSYGLSVRQQFPVRVYYRGENVGTYSGDLLVEEKVTLELKTCLTLAPDNFAQLRNYLRATEIEVGLLLNFGPKPQFEREFFTNDRKRHISPIRPNPPDPSRSVAPPDDHRIHEYSLPYDWRRF